jgi:transforming growth factor-beta-induced protein
MQCATLFVVFGISSVSGAGLPACPNAIIAGGFCHPWELRDGGVACVRDTSPSAKITKPSDVQCVPKKNGGAQYKCPSWVPLMCQPVFDGKNIVELAAATPDLSTLVAALKAGKLTGALSGTGPFTVFAPTNEAFAKLPKGTLDHLLDPKNIKELDAILEYHVIAGAAVYKDDLKSDQKVKTLEGEALEIKKTASGQVLVGASPAMVILADVDASNGVVHIIDNVLMLPAPPTPQPQAQNIVKLAESVKDLSTLVAAVVAGDLADTLSSPGPFTVFAPTNEAFAALPRRVLEKLMKPENKKELVDILTYHVLPEKVLSTDLKASQVVKTVEGKPLHVTKSGNRVRVGASLKSKDLRNVIKADNVASNGVVHIIDGVLLPPSSTAIVATAPLQNIVKLAESNKDLSTLVSAVVAAGLVDTLSAPGSFTVFAPTNEAFKALPAGTLDKVIKPENKKELIDLLTYHVLGKAVPVKKFRSGERITTLEGQTVRISEARTSGGVDVYVNQARLTHGLKDDIKATNGVVHIIESVLVPPSPTPAPPTPAPVPATKNIVQLAESVKDLSTLVAAVVAGDLADTLSSPGPFTVFAPTNEAFAALPASVLEKLMKPENKKELVDILTYHVLPEKVLSTDLNAFQAVKTVEGKPLHVTKWGARVRVGPSLESKDLKNVIKADNLASNGVVHIIDGVLLPPMSQIIIV